MKPKQPTKKKEPKRTHRVTFKLNDAEFQGIESFLRRYKITDREKWYRTAVLTHVWRVLEEDYPTLFDENEMR